MSKSSLPYSKEVKQLQERLAELSDSENELYESLRFYQKQAIFYKRIASLYLPDISKTIPIVETLYLESFDQDEQIPISYPKRAL